MVSCHTRTSVLVSPRRCQSRRIKIRREPARDLQHRSPTDAHLPLRPPLVVLDEVNEALDRKPAQHLVSLYIEDNPETGGEDILVRAPIPFRLLPPCSYLGLTKKTKTIATGPAVCIHHLRQLARPSSNHRKLAFKRDSEYIQNMVRFEHCVPRHLALVVHTYHSSTSRCTCLTAMRHACPPTRHSSHFTWITLGSCTQITASGTLLPSSISTMLSVILKTQVFSASALSGAVAATILRNP